MTEILISSLIFYITCSSSAGNRLHVNLLLNLIEWNKRFLPETGKIRNIENCNIADCAVFSADPVTTITILS